MSGLKLLKRKEKISQKMKSKKLSIFDFDDTLVSTDAKFHITHSNGEDETLTPAEYAVYDPQEGDEFDFSEFDGPLKDPEIIRKNFKLFTQVLNKSRRGRRTVILTARENPTPVENFLKKQGIEGIEVVALGSSDPQDKADWIEDQAKAGWEDIRFMDDSHKNVSAVRAMAKNYPNIEWLIKKVRIH